MFDEQKAEQIVEHLSQGVPVSQIARQMQIGRRTIHDWREQFPSFSAQFARAKDQGYDAIADSIIEIADDQSTDTDRARLRCDARLKLLAKWDPKRYGDRIQSEVDMTIRVTIDDPTARTVATIAPKPALPNP